MAEESWNGDGGIMGLVLDRGAGFGIRYLALR